VLSFKFLNIVNAERLTLNFESAHPASRFFTN